MNDMVTVTRMEYDRLREAAEELADLQAYDKAMEDGGASIPHEFMARLIDGEPPLCVYRELRGPSQAALARAAGVNRVQINDIEAGRSAGSMATMKKLAMALAISLDDLAA